MKYSEINEIGKIWERETVMSSNDDYSCEGGWKW